MNRSGIKNAVLLGDSLTVETIDFGTVTLTLSSGQTGVYEGPNDWKATLDGSTAMLEFPVDERRNPKHNPNAAAYAQRGVCSMHPGALSGCDSHKVTLNRNGDNVFVPAEG